MTTRRRYLADQVERDLRKKMVFVAGPRQVGKTTLAKSLPGAAAGYLNWDVAEHRERILKRELPPGRLWIFDEIHKYRAWRGYLKGFFDDRPASQRILVTGSARLDLYRYGGDSLQGRHHLLRLHPLSAAELGLKTQDDLRQLLNLGGFPEPFSGGRRPRPGAGRASTATCSFARRSSASSACRTSAQSNCSCSGCRNSSARRSPSTR